MSLWDFIFLCCAAIAEGLDEVQKLCFDGHSKKVYDLIPNTFATMAHYAKKHASIQSALPCLHVNHKQSRVKSL